MRRLTKHQRIVTDLRTGQVRLINVRTGDYKVIRRVAK